MWANTAPDGGIIAIGVHDNGSIIGCFGKGEALIDVERRVRNDLVPHTTVLTRKLGTVRAGGGTDYVLLWWVRYHEDMVIKVKGDAFIRRANTRHKLSAHESRELELDKGAKSFEQSRCLLEYPDDFNEGEIDHFIGVVCKRKE
jgi:ATP-dependent DNA helicase RecG